jgi:hypothetical protein
MVRASIIRIHCQIRHLIPPCFASRIHYATSFLHASRVHYRIHCRIRHPIPPCFASSIHYATPFLHASRVHYCATPFLHASLAVYITPPHSSMLRSSIIRVHCRIRHPIPPCFASSIHYATPFLHASRVHYCATPFLHASQAIHYTIPFLHASRVHYCATPFLHASVSRSKTEAERNSLKALTHLMSLKHI